MSTPSIQSRQMLSGIHPLLAAAIEPMLQPYRPPVSDADMFLAGVANSMARQQGQMEPIAMPQELIRLAKRRDISPEALLALGAADREFGQAPVVVESFEQITEVLASNTTGLIRAPLGCLASDCGNVTLDMDFFLLDVTAWVNGREIPDFKVGQTIEYATELANRGDVYEVTCTATVQKLGWFYGRLFVWMGVEAVKWRQLAKGGVS